MKFDEHQLRESMVRIESMLSSVDAATGRIEKCLATPASKTKDGWDIFQILMSTSTPIIAGIFGFLLITTVNLTLQKEQVQLSGAKEMQGLLADLGNPDTPIEKAEASALALASFGRIAIVPLINELQSGTSNRQVAAEVGLRAIGVQDQSETCVELIGTIENRSRLYSWITQQHVLRLLGDLNCQQAVSSLRSYETIVEPSSDETLKAYSKFVADQPSPTLESLALVKHEVDRSLEILTSQPKH